MVNGLLDFGDQDGVSFQAGLGFGRAKVKLIDDKDSALAWQAILGIQLCAQSEHRPRHEV